MTDSGPVDTANRVALLCVGDVSVDVGKTAIPLVTVFGQVYLHHIIKQLQTQGISRFFIGVDHVPGILLAYRDRARDDGIDVQFVREPAALLPLIDARAQILVLQADTRWEPALLSDLFARRSALVATVEERTENQPFERIDLNSRWSGLAILERSTLEKLPQLPDGWDMASALLRQAVQDRIAMVPIRQAELQAGHLQKLLSAADIETALPLFGAANAGRPDTLEKRLFARPLERLSRSVWSLSWGPQLAEWSFPGLSGITLLLAAFGFSTASALSALLALAANIVRSQVHAAQYRRNGRDWPGIAAWGLMASALLPILNQTEATVFDAGFFALCLAGMTLNNGLAKADGTIRYLSPLTLILILCAGLVAGATGPLVRVTILAELCLLIFRNSPASKRKDAVD